MHQMNTSSLVIRFMLSLSSHSSHSFRLHMLRVKTGRLNPQPVMLLRSRLQRLRHQDPLSRFLLTSSVNDYKSPLLVVSPPLLSSPLLSSPLVLCSPLVLVLFLFSCLSFCPLFSSCPLLASSSLVLASSFFLSNCSLLFPSLVLSPPLVLSCPLVFLYCPVLSSFPLISFHLSSIVLSSPLVFSSSPHPLPQPQQEGPMLRGQTLGFCKAPRDHDFICTF